MCHNIRQHSARPEANGTSPIVLVVKFAYDEEWRNIITKVIFALAYIVNKAVCATAAMELHMCCYRPPFSCIYVTYISIHLDARRGDVRRRALSCVALRCSAGSGVNAALDAIGHLENELRVLEWSVKS